MNRLLQFLESGSRHKLVFISATEELRFVDIGRELSAKIESYVDDKNLSFEAEDCLEKLISSNVVDVEFGKYVAIKNIGILFEPALKLNLEAKIDSWSRSQVLFVNRAEGEIDDDIFYLKNREQKEFKINLLNITYKEIIL